jgi:transitional endoplasmic reticulum ATPase
VNQKTLQLLERALAVSPEDWETRAHLMTLLAESGGFARAAELLRTAPAIPGTEDAQLLKARIQADSSSNEAIQTLQEVLERNRACAQAYLALARIYQKRGLLEEARRKYGAATVIDESIADPELAALLGIDQELEPPKPKLVPVADEAGESLEERETAATENYGPGSRAKTTFADVAGMAEIIERIRMNIVYPFKNPEVFRKFNKRSGGGILMYGPPGCGKTHLARATAGECGATFISIAITDVLSKWLGESERHLHELFENARLRSPSVVFIDEIDAIGVNRSDAGASMAPIVNVLLTEMDGMSAGNDRVMVLAATNMPWRVDSALRRPGRFDRVIFVPPPDEPARRAILHLYLDGLPAESIDLDRLAKVTERFSGADLKALVERTAECAIADELRTGQSGKLTQRQLMETAKKMRPSTVEWLETARNYASFANRSGLYDDLVAYLERR